MNNIYESGAKMAFVTIDGIKLEVSEDKNMLDCALENGIYIPHLCHHPNLSTVGSCRLCLVEVEGEIVPSCTLMAKDGLDICTNNDQITKLRSLALELLLAGHPEDCTTCPKYGNCELQTLIQYNGANNARLRTRIRGFKNDESNPLFIHDMNRCVLCGRCVRACSELRGVEVLHYKKKDMETYVGTLHETLLKDADCRFCGACAEVCPTGTIRDKMQLLGSNMSKERALVPCRATCPAGTNVPRYIRFVKEGKYSEAAAVVRERAPLPKILGYICNHVCEQECRSKDVNDPLSIRNIKRFAAEHDTQQLWRGKGKQLPDTHKHIAVVGSGPAGLVAAYYLRKQGHSVTLKEALPEVGGMMRYGIPSYRLPREIVDEEANILFETGIVLEKNTYVAEPAKLLNEGYDAVLMAIGTHRGVRLPISGNTLPGVLINTDFLRAASMMEKIDLGNRVVVLGGGNVAFDCARTAKRLGAKEVHLACLESLDQMPADLEEIHQGQEEGIHIHPSLTFDAIVGETHVTGVNVTGVESFSFDENRRIVITKKENSSDCIQADTVIFAVGQQPNISESAGLTLGRGNTIYIQEGTLKTSVEGIFAAGDATYGTNSVIKAIAAGRQAAIEIDQFLGGEGNITEVLAPVEIPNPFIGKIKAFAYNRRKHSVINKDASRNQTFNLVDYGLSEDIIGEEAKRCLQCDLRLSIAPARLWSDYSSDKEVK